MEKTQEATFQDDISGDTPVLVDFWAEWCGPCRILHPILEEIAKERDDIKILSLDVDENQKIAQEYSVQGIPTMILFRNGKEEKRLVGALRKQAILQELAI